jgi:PAS domain S-box-containing protein
LWTFEVKSETPTLRLMVEHSPIPMGILRLDGTVEYLNPTFSTTFGYTTQSAKDVPGLISLLAPDATTRDGVTAFWNTELMRYAASGEAIPCRTWLMRNAQDEILHVQIQASVVQDRLVVVYSDVTALKQAEARLERLTQHTSSLLVELSPTGQVLFANRHAEEDPLKVEPGETIRALNWPTALQEALARTVASRASVAIDYSRSDPGDAPRHYQASFRPVSENGRLRCVVLTLTDITERRAIDELLAMRTAALEATTDGIAITEARTDACPIVYVDRAFERLTGWQGSRVLGRTCRDLLCADATLPQTLDAITNALRDGIPFDDEALLRRSDGSTFWSHLRILPHANSNHVVTHHVWLVLDITAQKQSEEEILAQQRELARLGRLAVMGEVGAAYAHELAQPLSALVGNATVALTSTCNCASNQCGNQEVLQDILDSVQRLRHVFDRLRSLNRPSPCARELLDLNEVVREAITLFRQDADTSSVRLETRLHGRLPRLWLDRVQIQQVLINLLNNALDALATVPTPRRRIEVRTSPARLGAVCLAVRDHGTGIPAQVLPQLFSRCLTTKAEGTGIGLRLCHRIIEAHRGTLSAENNSRHGATFRVLLPVDHPQPS